MHLEPGITEALARERALRIADVRYDIFLSVPADIDAPVTGRVAIAFTLGESPHPLVIDFAPGPPGRLHGVADARGPVAHVHTAGHVVVPSDTLVAGANGLTLEFDAGDGSIHRGADFLYTLFVPARAHEAFPCFDQPDLKARWTLTLEVPEGWEAVSNAPESWRHTRLGRTRVAFTETVPLPTYLFACAAGRFAVERGEVRGRTLRVFHRETNRETVTRNRHAVVELHVAALEWLDRYTGVPYPFEKLDVVLLPAFPFGGMEHAGAIFYNAASLFLEPSATPRQLAARASLVAHETAHMWFGDLVTMRWFDDVWLKEVFANFMAARIVGTLLPDASEALQFLLAYYPSVYAVDRTAGTHAIRQPLENLRDAGSLYGPIIYDKAPIVMRQLEATVGASVFRAALHEYLRRHAFGNADWPELVEILTSLSDVDVRAWSRIWIERPGRPIVRTRIGIRDGRVERLVLEQDAPSGDQGLGWDQSLLVAVGTADQMHMMPVEMRSVQVEVTAARGMPTPNFVLPSAGGLGYGAFHLDETSQTWLMQDLPRVRDPLTRASAWLTLWEAMLDGRAPTVDVIDLALRLLPGETDEMLVHRLLVDLAQAFWQFSTDPEREVLAPRVERVLIEGLEGSATPRQKSALFATLRHLATTGRTLAYLTAVWRHDARLDGVTLGEADDILLAQELAVREVPAWDVLLEQQFARTINPDRRAQLQFVMPALAAREAERAAFFASLANAANRRHERWVVEALGYLHHPLRAASAVRYIEPGLALLPEIERTGDIFFPKRWVDATLGGHRSPGAAAQVRPFIEARSAAFPDHLRRLILVAADPLFRAASRCAISAAVDHRR